MRLDHSGLKMLLSPKVAEDVEYVNDKAGIVKEKLAKVADDAKAAANEPLKATRHAGTSCKAAILMNLSRKYLVGADAVDSATEYVQESRKQASKKAKETAEETSEKAQKAKRNADL
ncbi:unnamed protein product [Adineta ricciae]|uniref:Uncharacterized protein n=1 Tax=Adineta ricciae TaxID=249248 RepID=A0A815WUD0_ADIRI|nr:unnamed protein product [Adineta ricciae]